MLPEFFRRNPSVKVLLLVLILAVLFFLIDMGICCHHFVTRTYTVRSSRIKENATIAFVTDLHDTTFGKKNQKLLAAIDAASPDLVLVGGDTIISRHAREDEDGWQQVTLDLYEALSEKYPVYFADGNHEGRLFDPTEENGVAGSHLLEGIDRVTKGRAVYLNNKTVVTNGAAITGLNLPHDSYQKLVPTTIAENEVESLVGKADRRHFQILLAHNPKYFHEYAAWGADLVLSGHVHGGLMRLPHQRGAIAPDLSLFPEYAYGTYFLKKGSARRSTLKRGEKSVYLPADTTELILSCGLGSHTLPIRIFNPGELSIIRLEPENKRKQ